MDKKQRPLPPNDSSAPKPQELTAGSLARMSPDERQTRISELQHRLATEPRITESRLDELLKNYLPNAPVDWGKPQGKEIW